jgi:hypothetical protein
MKRLITALVLCLLLVGCATPASLPASPGADPTRSPAETADATAAPRSATLTLLEKKVESRQTESQAFASAADGETLPIGGQVQTGEDSRVRLDLKPEGTIVRLAPNSLFTLTALSNDNGAPKSKFLLAFGKMWVLLSGGSLDVETPSGVASVRGSLLSVSFDPQNKTITVTCREGHCSLADDNEEVDLTSGEAVESVDGDIADEARMMTDEELQDWEQEVPETDTFIEEHPAATDVPTDIATLAPTDVPTDIPTDAPATDAPADTSSQPPIDNGGGDPGSGG